MFGKDRKDKIVQRLDQDTSVQSTRSASSNHSALKGHPNSRGELGLKDPDLSVHYGKRDESERKPIGEWAESMRYSGLVWDEPDRDRIGDTGGEAKQKSHFSDSERQKIIQKRLTKKKHESRRDKIDIAMYETLSKDVNNFMNSEFNKDSENNTDIMIVGGKLREALSESVGIATYFRSDGVWASIGQELRSRDKEKASGGFKNKSADALDLSLKKAEKTVNEDASYYKPETVEAFFEKLGEFKFRKKRNVPFDSQEKFSMEKLSESQRGSIEEGVVSSKEDLSMAEKYRQYVYKNSIRKNNDMCVVM